MKVAITGYSSAAKTPHDVVTILTITLKKSVVVEDLQKVPLVIAFDGDEKDIEKIRAAGFQATRV